MLKYTCRLEWHSAILNSVFKMTRPPHHPTAIISPSSFPFLKYLIHEDSILLSRLKFLLKLFKLPCLFGGACAKTLMNLLHYSLFMKNYKCPAFLSHCKMQFYFLCPGFSTSSKTSMFRRTVQLRPTSLKLVFWVLHHRPNFVYRPISCYDKVVR